MRHAAKVAAWFKADRLALWLYRRYMRRQVAAYERHMKRVRIVAAALMLLAYCSSAQAAWLSGTVQSIEPYGDGQLLIVLLWTDDAGKTDKGSMVVQPGTATASIQTELTRRNARDTAVSTDLKVGTVVRPASAVVPPVPTQDEVDGAAFGVLVRAWLVEVAKLGAKVGSQGAIDAAAGALAAPYAGAKNQATKARYDALLLAASRGGLF